MNFLFLAIHDFRVRHVFFIFRDLILWVSLAILRSRSLRIFDYIFSMASSASASSTPSPTVTSTVSSIQDFSNLYFIHSNENPSSKIVTAVLDGSNYHGWAQAMTMMFEMKNKLGFIDGTIQKPSDFDPNFAQWKRCSNLIQSWINHSVTPEIATSVIWLTQASDVWNALCNRFSQGDYIRILQIHSYLYFLKQGDLSIRNYFTKVKILWDELCNFRSIPSCESWP